MSTVAIKKSPVEAKWSIQKIQEDAARAFAVQGLSAMAVISKQGDQAVKEYQDNLHKFQIEHLKALGVKTPLELAKAKAEFEVNVFGSKIEIEGDESSARIIYNQCAVQNAMQKYGHLSAEKQEKIGQYFQICVQNFAKEWGFKGEVQFEGTTCTVTYSK